VSDLVTSATWATHELKGFRRVAVPAKSSVKAEIVIPAATLSIVNAAAQRVVEPGDFEIQVGASSADIKSRIKINIKAQ
jgi:beta-glucosidase